MPEASHPRPLTPTARRALCAAMLDTAAGIGPGPALLVADVLDAVSGAVLAAAGLTDPGAARALLASLWAYDGGGLTEQADR